MYDELLDDVLVREGWFDGEWCTELAAKLFFFNCANLEALHLFIGKEEICRQTLRAVQDENRQLVSVEWTRKRSEHRNTRERGTRQGTDDFESVEQWKVACPAQYQHFLDIMGA